MSSDIGTGRTARPTLRSWIRALFGSPTVAVAFVFLSLLVLAAVILPMVDPSTGMEQDLGNRNAPPSLLGGDSPFILGADQLGRDVLSRLLVAGRVSLGVSAAVVAVAVPVGTLLGLISGYYGGAIGDLIMRAVDVTMSFPGLLLAVVVLFIAGPGVIPMIAVLAVARWPVFARVARAETLRVREEEFVEASRLLGFPRARIVFREILPNILAPIFPLAIVNIPQVMFAEASLSFLGVGVQPPDSSWGLMVAQGQSYITSAWWLVVLPGVAIVTTTMAVSVLADVVHTGIEGRSAEEEPRIAVDVA